ncbi:MAG: leucine-rich repeat protein, partial [Christensenellales bacterium]
MKRSFIFIAAVLTLCFCVMLFAACEYNAGSTVDGKDTPIDDGPHEIEQTVRYAVTVDDYLTVKSYEYEEGKTVTVTAPDVKNKLFVGWYYQGEKKTERKEYEFVVREDASVRAEYVDAYTVRLDAGEGTVETAEITVGKGMTYVLPVPTRKNYRFVGWTWSNMTITGEDGESLEAFFFDNDVILTARYEEKPKFTVSVSNGEREREDFVYYQDEEIRIKAEDLSETGRKLVGWYEITIVDGETKETKITDDDELTFTVKGDAEYVAKYVLSYSVILWIDSEVGINDYEAGETAEISLASVPVGKEFLYWFDMDTNEILSYEFAFSFDVDRNREIKAVFEYIDYYITYILDDVEEKKETYHYNDEVELWIPEAETHKYFGGWSESIRRMPAEDKTLYGNMFWEKHVLTVVDGEGSGEYDYNSEVTLTPKNYRGKKFVEWRIDDDVFTGDENGVYSFRLTKNTVCNGVYEWIDYSVEYKVYGGDWAQEGETYATVSGLHYGQKTDILPSPELSELREGHYTFGGWTKEGVSVEGSLVMPDGNVVIEGVFTVHTHEIEVKNGSFYGTEDKRIVAEWGQALTVAADIPTGKYFVGWFSDGQIVSEEEVFVFNVWGDVVIEGQTGDKKYSVVYMLTDTDGSEREYRSFNDCRYGASFPVPEEPRETHKVFGGWSYCGGALPQTVPDVEGQMTVVGSFSWQKYTVTVTNGYLFDGFETTGTFDYNTVVTVRAVYSEANADWYSFLDWFDVDDKAEIRDAEERYEFNLAKNVNLRADFVKTDFKARFFTRTDGGEYAKYGETTFNVDKKLSATVLGEVPAEERTHYDFSGWKLADGTAVPETLSPGDVDIYGEYTVVSYAIRSEYYNEETLDSGAMDEKVAPYGTTVKLVASERTGETFVRWVNAGGSLVSPDKEITVSVEGDRTYRAVYKRMRVGVTVPEGSAVTVKSGEYIKAEEKYVYGSVISITAPTADYVPEGKAFDYWNKNGERYAATERIEAEITEDVVFAVIYSNIVYNVFYHAEGTIVTSEGVVTYYKEDLFDFGDERLNPQTAVFGEGITLNALPSAPEHYQFFGWYRDDGYTQKESDSIGMPSRDVHLYGRYVIDRHNLEVKYITASGDAIDGAEGSGEYDYGTEIALAPGEVTGQHFVKWICGGTEYTDEIYNLTLREDTTVTAVYEYTYYKTTYYTADSVNGVVGASALYYEQTDIKYGDTVTVTASPADDREEFVFGGWTIDGENVGTEFVMPDSDVVVLGVFYSRFNYELNESGNYIVSAVSEYKNNYPDVLTIPSEYDGKAVVGIKEGGFSDIVSTKITVPSSITTVGRMAFSGVRAEEIAVCSVYGGYFGYLFGATDYQNQGSEVPDSLKKIKITGCAVPENAFYGLNKITSVELDGVTAVGNQAFYNCSSVSSLTIPETVSTIGDGAFYGMQSCAELNYYASATLGGNAFGYFAYKSSGATVTFGGAATAVPASAFEASANIASLVLSEGVSEVGARAFYGVTALKNVSFPSTLISIGEYAFYRVSIETLTIPETVASIGAQAFGETTSLTTINYGAVSASASDAFVSAGSTENTVTLYIGEGVENIQNGAFRNSNINTVEFAENSSLVSVGAEAFYCSALTGISLPEGATTIGSNAFGGANITEVVVPSTVTTIGEGAFSDCPKLSSVIYGATASDGYSAYTTVFADSGTESGITVTVKSNVSVVPSYMFGGAEKERMHIIGVRFEQNSVCTAIGEYAFANNPISTLEIGKEVLRIENLTCAASN